MGHLDTHLLSRYARSYASSSSNTCSEKFQRKFPFDTFGEVATNLSLSQMINHYESRLAVNNEPFKSAFNRSDARKFRS